MGTFGAALATKLAANGCRVTGVDQRRDRPHYVADRMTWPNEHSVRVCDTAFLFWTAQGLRTGERLLRVQWAG